jgi:hypothetical protein
VAAKRQVAAGRLARVYVKIISIDGEKWIEKCANAGGRPIVGYCLLNLIRLIKQRGNFTGRGREPPVFERSD